MGWFNWWFVGGSWVVNGMVNRVVNGLVDGV